MGVWWDLLVWYTGTFSILEMVLVLPVLVSRCAVLCIGTVLVPALVLNSAPRGTVCSDSTWYSWYCIEMQMWVIHGVQYWYWYTVHSTYWYWAAGGFEPGSFGGSLELSQLGCSSWRRPRGSCEGGNVC